MSERGQIPRVDVLALIESYDRLWVRLAAVKDCDEWYEAIFEIISGPQPPKWSPERWRYDDVIFLSTTTDGPTAADWLRTEQLVVDDLKIRLPVTPDPLNWDRHASNAESGYEVLPWPVTEYDLAREGLKKGPGSGSLIAPDAPSFVQFRTAAGRFFGVDLGPSGSMDHLRPAFRQQDDGGRICSVRWSVAEVAVTIEGSELDGTIVELASDAPSQSHALTSETPQTVYFALGDGVPSGAWVVLKLAFDWIDRKSVNLPYTIHADPGVEMIFEPQEQLQILVSAGEGAEIEFKQELPKTGSKGDRNFLRTVSAFANGDGGHILFGVADNGDIVGLNREEAERTTQDAITNLVRNFVAPLPEYGVTVYDVEGDPERVVLVLTVQSGATPPYGINPANPSYYVRRGATTFPASADQVRKIARSRPPAGQEVGIFGRATL